MVMLSRVMDHEGVCYKSTRFKQSAAVFPYFYMQLFDIFKLG